MTAAVKKASGFSSILGPVGDVSSVRKSGSWLTLSVSTCSMSAKLYSASILRRCAWTAAWQISCETLSSGATRPGVTTCSIPPMNCCSTSSSAAIRHLCTASALAFVTERSDEHESALTALEICSSRIRRMCASSCSMLGSMTNALASRHLATAG
eukprot:scaffold4357_cov113-Isochrysis_galbana.AAC.18